MWYCGIDIGTTNTKAVLLDKDVRFCDEVSLPAPAIRSGRVDASQWLGHIEHLLERFVGKCGCDELVCHITCQGGSFVITDGAFKARSGFSWMGHARAETLAAMHKAFDGDAFYHKTGWTLSDWLMAGKLKECPLGQGDYALTIPAYVRSAYHGEAVTDFSNAQITGLADFHTGQWDGALLDWVGVTVGQLGVISSTQSLEPTHFDYQKCRVTITDSSHDQYALMYALDLRDGQVALGTGTAWVINGVSDEPYYEVAGQTVHPGRYWGSRYGYIATLGAVGKGLELLLQRYGWSFGQLSGMTDELRRVGLPDNAVEVSFAQGVVADVDNGVAAVKRYMEAAAAWVRYYLETKLCQSGEGALLMTGGATQSRLWCELIATICQRQVMLISSSGLTAWGAARRAYEVADSESAWPGMDGATCETIDPQPIAEYETWWRDYQKPMLSQGVTLTY